MKTHKRYKQHKHSTPRHKTDVPHQKYALEHANAIAKHGYFSCIELMIFVKTKTYRFTR